MARYDTYPVHERNRKPISIGLDHPEYRRIHWFVNQHPHTMRSASENTQYVRRLFDEAGTDFLEWFQLAVDNWMATEGRYCEKNIVREFQANMKAIAKLLKALQETEAKYPRPYPPPYQARFVKR
ncbi:hypothetical protein GO755_40075 [Spirosoma sp. HMF4905]|uniref:Uncharacterized protein n=1 Tax=Spirosoma arboris TaxID=2682092 RepID=A0A7K1SR32_9BACT|nr:hypothetical protein [Spirosoma arboris]MVM36275.1 hypothetical protein [Spirosoma arboris]